VRRTGSAGADRLAHWMARRPVERAAFDFLWTLSGRDRKFKLRTYPSIALVLVLGVAMIANDPQGFRHALETLPQGHKYLLMLYVCCALAPTSLLQLRYSDQYEAAWIYRALPLAAPGEVLRAGLKVVILRLVAPSFALITVVILALWPWSVWPDLVLGFCAILLTCAVQALVLGKQLPFSEPFAMTDASGRVGRSFAMIIPALALGGVHYLLTTIPVGVPVAIPIVVLITGLTLRSYGRASWTAVLAESK